MKSPSELGEDLGQSVSRKSPRAGGVLAIGLAGATIGLAFALDKAALLIIAGLVLGCGIWIAATGRNWKVPDDKPPLWWKAGFLVTAGVGVIMSYVCIFAGWAGGF